MATAPEKLARSLSVLKEIQDSGKTALRTGDMSRVHRERLLKNGFIQMVMQGWYIPARPDEAPGESTSWHISFWGFCADYLNSRFNRFWCLSPEQSLSLHTGNWAVPRQLVLRSPRGSNKPTGLLHGTSLLDLRLKLPGKNEITEISGEGFRGLRIMTLPAALIACAPSLFAVRPLELRLALSMMNDASDILPGLLADGRSTVAGRLAGAFRNIGRGGVADAIVDTMRSAGHTVYESDPFEEKTGVSFGAREISPHVNRVRMMWAGFREAVIRHFPKAPRSAVDIKARLRRIDGIYAADAYNSLSIEGYRVDSELIERVREGRWDPDGADRGNRDALAARGYWQAFQAVRLTITDVFEGKNPGEAVADDFGRWYREMFGPSVAAGIVGAAELAGYRRIPVYIRGSRHVPPGHESVRELMLAFLDLLRNEASPEARAVLGHFVFVYIHPFADGNGRVARFLMNVMLAAGGYPWLVIPVEKRSRYMETLEDASVGRDIVPFTEFLAGLVERNRFSDME